MVKPEKHVRCKTPTHRNLRIPGGNLKDGKKQIQAYRFVIISEMGYNSLQQLLHISHSCFCWNYSFFSFLRILLYLHSFYFDINKCDVARC